MDPAQLRENRKVWQEIAESFDKTRTKPWDAVVAFIEELPPSALVLDAGCGNGRHATIVQRSSRRLIGLDLSRRLLQRARLKTPGASWLEAAVERVPLKDATVDAVLAIAVLHHVRGERNRLDVLREFVRVLKPGGRLLLSVWSQDQPRFKKRPPTVPADARPVEPGDAWIRWTQHGLDVPRFMHLYSWLEWHRELDAAGLRIERVWPEAIMTDDEPDNFFAIVRKKPGTNRHNR